MKPAEQIFVGYSGDPKSYFRRRLDVIIFQKNVTGMQDKTETVAVNSDTVAVNSDIVNLQSQTSTPVQEEISLSPPPVGSGRDDVDSVDAHDIGDETKLSQVSNFSHPPLVSQIH